MDEKRMPQARGHKARYREEAFYDLEAKAKQRIEERQMRRNRRTFISVLRFSNVSIVESVGEKVILDKFYYNFSRFEKMGIVGNNSTGKSTFIKLLLRVEAPDDGRFDIGETVKFGYFSQDGLKFDEQQR